METTRRLGAQPQLLEHEDEAGDRRAERRRRVRLPRPRRASRAAPGRPAGPSSADAIPAPRCTVGPSRPSESPESERERSAEELDRQQPAPAQAPVVRHRFLDVRDAAAGRLGREAPGEPARERRPGAEQCREREPAETTRYERRDPLARPGSVGTEGQPVPASDQTRDPAGDRRAHGRARIERGWPLAGRVCHAPLRPSLRPTRATRRSRAVISGGVQGMRGPGDPGRTERDAHQEECRPVTVEESGEHRVELTRRLHACRPAIAGGARHLVEGDAIRDGRLAAGGRVRRVVEADVQQVRGARGRDRGERAQVHQHVAVAVEHDDAAIGTRQRDAEADRRGQPHRADHVEAGVGVARAERRARQEAVRHARSTSSPRCGTIRSSASRSVIVTHAP